jgi:hypothetical protein
MPVDYQTSQAVLVAIQEETVRGTKATDAPGSAYQLRIMDSPGLDPDRTNIQNEENRTDGTTAMPRLGSLRVPATYNMPLTVGGAIDVLWKAIMRGTWTASTDITNTQMTSITTTTSTIVATAGSWLTQGVRVGQVVRLSGHSTAANNDRNLRVVSVSALVIGVAGTGTDAATPLTANAVADTSFTLTILKRLNTPAAPVRVSHTIDQYGSVMDQSLVGSGMRLTGFNLRAGPDGIVTVGATYLGAECEVLTTAASPYFTTPTVTTGLALVVNDSVIRYNGADLLHFTGFDLNFQIEASTLPVGGGIITPDVYDSTLTVSGTITVPRFNLANMTLWRAETEFDAFILVEEPTALPRPCQGIYLSRIKLTKANAPAGGGTGALIETLTLTAHSRAAATGYESGLATISSSAA